MKIKIQLTTQQVHGIVAQYLKIDAGDLTMAEIDASVSTDDGNVRKLIGRLRKVEGDADQPHEDPSPPISDT